MISCLLWWLFRVGSPIFGSIHYRQLWELLLWSLNCSDNSEATTTSQYGHWVYTVSGVAAAGVAAAGTNERDEAETGVIRHC